MKLPRTLLAGILCIWGFLAFAQSRSLLVERRGEQLYVSAPLLRLFQGRALEKLHNGSTVAYVVTLAAVAERTGKSAFTLRKRFVLSFDLWEEKYSVVLGGPEGHAASRLTAAMAEAWCLENMPIPVRAVQNQQPFVLELECSIDENDAANGSNENSALTLSGLIDIFSRKNSAALPRWEASAGPLRLSEVKSVK